MLLLVQALLLIDLRQTLRVQQRINLDLFQGEELHGEVKELKGEQRNIIVRKYYIK
jgi:hypothetical protein